LTRSLVAARRGSQLPRVANYPPAAYSDADEVIDLYEAVVGRELDEWQQFVLRQGLGRIDQDQWAAWKIGCWVPRQNGKGDIILALELAWLFLPGFQVPLVTHSAHLYPTAQEAFLRMKDVLDGSDWLRPKIHAIRETNGEQAIILRSGQRLKFMSRTRTGGRGFSSPRVVLDEGQELQPLMMAAAIPTMSAQPDPQVWIFGTPPDVPTAWAYDLKEDGEAGAPDVCWLDWGLDLNLGDKNITEQTADQDLWYQANPALGVRITERFVAGEHRPSGLGAKFPAERLGVWLPRAGGCGVISDELWRDLIVAAGERPERPVCMIDVSPDRSSASIVMAGVLADGRVLISMADHRPGTGWIVDRAAALNDRWKPVLWIIDGGKSPAMTFREGLAGVGITEPVPEDEGGDGRLHHGNLLILDAVQTALAWGVFVDAVNQRQVVHMDEAPLNAALGGARIRNLGDGSAWARRGNTDITPIVGATGGTYAALRIAPGITDHEDAEPGAFWI